MFSRPGETALSASTPFASDFDDRAWTDHWLRVPIALVPPMVHPDGTRIERRMLYDADIFGRPYHLTVPLDTRFLTDPQGRMWMSTTPQEHIMMFNNGEASYGHVLVGGLGLGLYPQYAEAVGQAERFTVIEASPVIHDLVTPTLEAALTIPLEVRIEDAESMLAGPVEDRYDTIFLDTWEALDAANLPSINRLRDQAIRHLAPKGRLLLWGYGWMVELFEIACAQILGLPPDQREDALASASDQARDLLAARRGAFRRADHRGRSGGDGLVSLSHRQADRINCLAGVPFYYEIFGGNRAVAFLDPRQEQIERWIAIIQREPHRDPAAFAQVVAGWAAKREAQRLFL